jgi:hypothetical protein
MGKLSKKQIDKTLKSDEPIEYDKLRLDVLKSLVESRNIDCKPTKEVMVKTLIMDDEGKYIRPIEYQKQSDNKFMVGIDIRDSDNCREMGKLVEKGIAHRMNLYSNDRVYYISSQKLS